jgi:hypothetical protein
MFEVRDARLILHLIVLYCRHHGEIKDGDGREDGCGGPTVSLGVLAPVLTLYYFLYIGAAATRYLELG